MAKTPKVKCYRLAQKYWDGRELHPRNSVMQFEEGSQPSSAVEVPANAKPVQKANDTGPKTLSDAVDAQPDLHSIDKPTALSEIDKQDKK